mmetsp:Transcript_59360/g.142431  ORF Transcript_59360/g.142431 Transcript_59360/m.142431 type:complete len:501 (-) Transcript_59360:610-2112(-)
MEGRGHLRCLQRLVRVGLRLGGLGPGLGLADLALRLCILGLELGHLLGRDGRVLLGGRLRRLRVGRHLLSGLGELLGGGRGGGGLGLRLHGALGDGQRQVRVGLGDLVALGSGLGDALGLPRDIDGAGAELLLLLRWHFLRGFGRRVQGGPLLRSLALQRGGGRAAAEGDVGRLLRRGDGVGLIDSLLGRLLLGPRLGLIGLGLGRPAHVEGRRLARLGHHRRLRLRGHLRRLVRLGTEQLRLGLGPRLLPAEQRRRPRGLHEWHLGRLVSLGRRLVGLGLGDVLRRRAVAVVPGGRIVPGGLRLAPGHRLALLLRLDLGQGLRCGGFLRLRLGQGPRLRLLPRLLLGLLGDGRLLLRLDRQDRALGGRLPRLLGAQGGLLLLRLGHQPCGEHDLLLGLGDLLQLDLLLRPGEGGRRGSVVHRLLRRSNLSLLLRQRRLRRCRCVQRNGGSHCNRFRRRRRGGDHWLLRSGREGSVDRHRDRGGAQADQRRFDCLSRGWG